MSHNLQRGDELNLKFIGNVWSQYGLGTFTGQVTAVQDSFVEVFVKGGVTHWFEVHNNTLAEAAPTWPNFQLQTRQSDYALKAHYEKVGRWL
jgi:hypothetical protein